MKKLFPLNIEYYDDKKQKKQISKLFDDIIQVKRKGKVYIVKLK